MNDSPGIAATLPVSLGNYALPPRSGLIVVDVVKGFCTPGHGPLAPTSLTPSITRMVNQIDSLSRRFLSQGKPVILFKDRHTRSEPPYPDHCWAGSGDEEMVDDLSWLEEAPGVTSLYKDCINSAVGAILDDGPGGATRNALHDWITGNALEAVVFVGICTDICVADAALTLVSTRNHYVGDRPMLGELRDIVVYEPGCATYDLPLETARLAGLPDSAAHPEAVAHHVGLWMMQSRGALLANAFT